MFTVPEERLGEVPHGGLLVPPLHPPEQHPPHSGQHRPGVRLVLVQLGRLEPEVQPHRLPLGSDIVGGSRNLIVLYNPVSSVHQ